MNSNNMNNPPQGRRRRNRRGRGRPGDTLTGGTRDVKPQMLSFVATQSGNDTTTTVTQALPVLRNFQPSPGRAQLVEILKVSAILPSPTEVDNNINIALSTKNFGTTAVTPQDPSVFAFIRRAVALTTSGQIYADLVACLDLTDGNGNGILVATDNIYCQIVSSSTGSTNATAIKILYRISGASVEEYVGIVQSQQ